MTTSLIETLCAWSKPKRGIHTSRGVRSLRVAVPTPTFWAAWRSDKAALKELGVSCKPVGNKEWEAQWWQADEEFMPDAGRKSDERATARPFRNTTPIASEPDAAGLRDQRETPNEAGISTTGEGASGATLRDGGSDRQSEVGTNAAEAELPPSTAGEKLAGTDAGLVDTRAASVPADVDDLIAKAIADAKEHGRSWSDEQIAIFRHFAAGTGNAIVQARAGTGKTTTIKEAFKFAPEQDCLYAVFNKKNQREAVAKITDPRVDIKTLHGLGFGYIKSVWRDAKPDDTVEYDRVSAAFANIPDEAATAVVKLVSFAKNLFVGLPTVGMLEDVCDQRDIYCGLENPEDGGWTTTKLSQVALKAMALSMERDGAGRISFNDMVWLPVAMNWVRARYSLVVVDEAQDMNMPQLLMATRACRKDGRIVVVGDDRQAIYGFRGAASNGMAVMARELKAKTFGLTTTYRCPKAVVAMATPIVADYKAAPSAPEGVVLNNSECEMYEKIAVGDAVLSRSNAPLMSACLSLLKRGIPARIEGRDIGKPLVAMVRKLKARSVPDFLARLSRWEQKQLNRLKNVNDSEAKVQAIRDQRETLEAVAEGCTSVSEIERRITSLFQDSDEAGVKPAVVCSTVHKAKGLEWDNVYHLSWTFGRRKTRHDREATEEANTLYVAITRAKKTLTIVHSGGSPTVKEDKDGVKQVAA